MTDRTATLVTGGGNGVGDCDLPRARRRAVRSCGSTTSTRNAPRRSRPTSVADRSHAAVKADVTSPVKVRACARTTGPVDILVNNAGIPTLGVRPEARSSTPSPDDWEASDAPQPRRGAARHPRVPRRDGRAAGGVASSRSSPTRAARASAARRSTASAKAGAMGFMRGLAAEVGAHGVTANCVSLGTMRTGPDCRRRSNATPISSGGWPAATRSRRSDVPERRRAAGRAAVQRRRRLDHRPGVSRRRRLRLRPLAVPVVAGGAGVTVVRLWQPRAGADDLDRRSRTPASRRPKKRGAGQGHAAAAVAHPRRTRPPSSAGTASDTLAIGLAVARS